MHNWYSDISIFYFLGFFTEHARQELDDDLF